MHAITRGVVGYRRDLEKVLCTSVRFFSAEAVPESPNTHLDSALRKTGVQNSRNGRSISGSHPRFNS